MKRILSVPVLSIALLLMAACSGGGAKPAGGPSSASNDAPANAMANFAKCMREHGQNVPDPDPNSSDHSIIPPSGAASPQWNAATQACRHLMPGGGQPQAPDQRQLNALRAYAVCMREHGIEVTDPDPNTGQSQIGGRLANASRQEIQNDPGYKSANEGCQDKLAEVGGKGK